MLTRSLLVVGVLATLIPGVSANALHPSFPPSAPPAIRPAAGATIQGYNALSASLADTGLTPGRAYVLTLVDENGDETDTFIAVTVGPDLLDPKSGITLDFWDASIMETADDPAIHLGQAFFKIDKSGITFYGFKEGVNPVLRPRATTLFPKGVAIASKAKMGIQKTMACPSKNGYGNPGNTAVTTNQGRVGDSNLVGFVWQTASDVGIGIIVSPGSGLASLWLGGYYYVVTH
jgi:hypothetical protein